ncbi:MAG: AIPR family protein, partial [Oscillospiraceae bacterium]|nr:AIPR family protein [Oscillospiraceae bacterium]
MNILEKIKNEIENDRFYQDHFTNDGFRFVAWYVRRILLQNTEATKIAVVDGANDKKIDALVIDDENRNIIIIQGKFYGTNKIDSEPLNEILSAWIRLQDLHSLQNDGNNKLKERIEVLRQALDDEYNIIFELLTTGELTQYALSDYELFSNKLEESKEFSASITLVNTPILEARLTEAEAKQLPMLIHTVNLDSDKVMMFDIKGTRSIITALPLVECLRFPGISDQKLFRKNVRQSLGWNTVNKRIKSSLKGERPQDFFFSHNGITAICTEFTLNESKTKLECRDLNVINGCQSLTTIYRCSENIRQMEKDTGYILFRFYEIPQKDLVDRISINTNSQSAVKPRDLRSNDRVVLSLKRSYEAMYPDGLLLNQRGMDMPGNVDKSRVIDVGELAKMIMAWHCQRPNTSYNEKKLFDELYKNVFKTDYDPISILSLNTWGMLISESWNI